MKYASIAIPNPEEREEMVFVEYLLDKTTSTTYLEVLDLSVGASRPSWIDLILDYLRDGSLPSDRKEVRNIIYKDTNYTIIDRVLYK